MAIDMAVPRAQGAVGKDFTGSLDPPGKLATLVHPDVAGLGCAHLEVSFWVERFYKINLEPVFSLSLLESSYLLSKMYGQFLIQDFFSFMITSRLHKILI
jgi:hypothetical protein